MPKSADRLEVIVNRGEVGMQRTGNHLRRPAFFEVQAENTPEFSGIKNTMKDFPQLSAFQAALLHLFEASDYPTNSGPSA